MQVESKVQHRVCAHTHVCVHVCMHTRVREGRTCRRIHVLQPMLRAATLIMSAAAAAAAEY